MSTQITGMTKGEMVLVEWEDSAQGHAEWQYLDDMDPPANIKCRTVGWLVNQTEDVLQLGATLGGINDSQVAGTITILAKCVVTIKPLATSSSVYQDAE